MASRKSPAPKLKRLQITADALPGAIFFSLPDLRDGCHDALTKRRAIDEYTRGDYEETRWVRPQWSELVQTFSTASGEGDLPQ